MNPHNWRVPLLAAAFLWSSYPAAAATFTVTTTAPFDPGSLQQAIIAANANPGADTIEFAIGSGTAILTPPVPFPVITGATTIDGSTQPGYTGTPLIVIEPAAAFNALEFANSAAEGRSRVDALFIRGAFHAVRTDTPITIARSILGETGPKSNIRGVLLTGNADDAVIRDNVIGGNEIGIDAQPAGVVERLTIAGNFIGVDADGTTPRPNTNSGIQLFSTIDTVIGGTTVADRNVISGNSTGVGGSGTVRTVVAGNYVGVNGSGTAAVAGQIIGVSLGDAQDAVIGGETTAARNVVSGNLFVGIAATGASDGVEILNNYVGVDAGGSYAIGNGRGISVGGANATIGRGSAGNVVSGSTAAAGFAIAVAVRSNSLIEGNRIGLDASGLNPIPNVSAGIETRLSADLLIRENLIAASGTEGIRLSGFAPDLLSTGIVLQRNRIGVNAAGAPVPNGVGVLIDTDANDNTIGIVSGATDGNVIAFNLGPGVLVTGTAAGNDIRGNSIDDNGGLGIDLFPPGATPNDPGDGDAGPNGLQNFPQIDAAAVSPAATFITGTLSSTPATAFLIDFYASPSADPSGFGEGRTFLGSTNVTTDAAGNAAFAAGVTAVPVGSIVTATATGPQGTSEFSAGVAAVAAPAAVGIPALDPGALIVLSALLALAALGALARP